MKTYFNQSGTAVLGHPLNICSPLFSLITVNMKSWNLWQDESKKTMSASKRAPDWSKHIWGNQRAAVRVSKQCPPSSLLTWHNRASKLDFCVFSAGRRGSVLFGSIVFRAQWALLLQIVMTQLSCRGASPQNTVFKGCKQVDSACRKDECGHGCYASEESQKWHFKNNDCV